MAQQEYISYWNISSYYCNISCDSLEISYWNMSCDSLEMSKWNMSCDPGNVILKHFMWFWKFHTGTFHVTLEMSYWNISCGSENIILELFMWLSGNVIPQHFMWLWKCHFRTFHVTLWKCPIRTIFQNFILSWKQLCDTIWFKPYRNNNCDTITRHIGTFLVTPNFVNMEHFSRSWKTVICHFGTFLVKL